MIMTLLLAAAPFAAPWSSSVYRLDETSHLETSEEGEKVEIEDRKISALVLTRQGFTDDQWTRELILSEATPGDLKALRRNKPIDVKTWQEWQLKVTAPKLTLGSEASVTSVAWARSAPNGDLGDAQVAVDMNLYGGMYSIKPPLEWLHRPNMVPECPLPSQPVKFTDVRTATFQFGAWTVPLTYRRTVIAREGAVATVSWSLVETPVRIASSIGTLIVVAKGGGETQFDEALHRAVKGAGTYSVDLKLERQDYPLMPVAVTAQTFSYGLVPFAAIGKTLEEARLVPDTFKAKPVGEFAACKAKDELGRAKCFYDAVQRNDYLAVVALTPTLEQIAAPPGKRTMDDARELRSQNLQVVGPFFTSVQRASAAFTKAAVVSAQKGEDGVRLTVKEGNATLKLLLTFKTMNGKSALIGVNYGS